MTDFSKRWKKKRFTMGAEVAARSGPLRRMRYMAEAGALYAMYYLLGSIPVTWSSALYGRLARWIGPHLPASNRAVRNLKHAYPEKDDAWIAATVKGMWENFGRTFGEYPRLRQLWDESIREQVEALGEEAFANHKPGDPPITVKGKHVEVVGVENFVAALTDGEPGLMYSAHMANWDLMPMGAARFGLTISVVFRMPNNPYTAGLLKYVRRGLGELLPKGLHGGIQSAGVLEKGGHLGMLVDQKFNRGLPVKFFGKDAMTAPTLAKLAYRFRCPVYGGYVERLEGANFRIHVLPPLELPDIEDEDAFIREVTTQVTQNVESWVRARPEQWFWLHRRWGKDI